MVSRMRSAGGRQSIALVTCAELGGLDRDTHLLVEPLRQLDLDVTAVAWTDPHVDWASFSLSIVRCCWDCPARPAEFLRWMDYVPRLANPASVIAWNMHKWYQHDLASVGVPTCRRRGYRRGSTSPCPAEARSSSSPP